MRRQDGVLGHWLCLDWLRNLANTWVLDGRIVVHLIVAIALQSLHLFESTRLNLWLFLNQVCLLWLLLLLDSLGELLSEDLRGSISKRWEPFNGTEVRVKVHHRGSFGHEYFLHWSLLDYLWSECWQLLLLWLNHVLRLYLGICQWIWLLEHLVWLLKLVCGRKQGRIEGQRRDLHGRYLGRDLLLNILVV